MKRVTAIGWFNTNYIYERCPHCQRVIDDSQDVFGHFLLKRYEK